MGKKAKRTKQEIDALSNDCMLNEEDAAEFLGFSRSSLNQWRRNGKGPQYLKYRTRSVRYKKADLISWSQANSSVAQSTVEVRMKNEAV